MSDFSVDASDVHLERLSLEALGGIPFGTVVADPPWCFENSTGKPSPEHGRLWRYATMELDDIMSMNLLPLMAPEAHCYLWVPNALLQEGLDTMKAWGFEYKTMLIWAKRRKDGGPDGRGLGFISATQPKAVCSASEANCGHSLPGEDKSTS